jgi:hypothetical protein
VAAEEGAYDIELADGTHVVTSDSKSFCAVLQKLTMPQAQELSLRLAGEVAEISSQRDEAPATAKATDQPLNVVWYHRTAGALAKRRGQLAMVDKMLRDLGFLAIARARRRALKVAADLVYDYAKDMERVGSAAVNPEQLRALARGIENHE